MKGGAESGAPGAAPPFWAQSPAEAAAALLSAATRDLPGAVIILVVLGASVTLDAIQEGGAPRAAEALRQSVALKAQVLRDGVPRSIDAEVWPR
jgi:magnesium-transporting ATPase (P-type)